MTPEEIHELKSASFLPREEAYHLVAEGQAEVFEEDGEKGQRYAVVRDPKTNKILFAQPIA